MRAPKPLTSLVVFGGIPKESIEWVGYRLLPTLNQQLCFDIYVLIMYVKNGAAYPLQQDRQFPKPNFIVDVVQKTLGSISNNMYIHTLN